MTRPHPKLAELEPGRARSELERGTVKPFHARQLYRWIYRHGIARCRPHDGSLAR